MRPPFAVSIEAAARIKSCVDSARDEPDLVGLVPVLYSISNYRAEDNAGRLVEEYGGRFFIIGWDNIEVVTNADCIETEIAGMRVYIPRRDLATTLAGAELVVETIAVGVPNPSDTMMEVLKAVPIGMPDLPHDLATGHS
jgi:hypothetical protein